MRAAETAQVRYVIGGQKLVTPMSKVCKNLDL
jgi:hypothetical protein